MNLFILRHAIAAEHDPQKYPDDSQRPLTKEGRRKMKEIARGMGKLGLEFEIILSSPFPRARQTAEIVLAEFLSSAKLKLTDHLAVGGSLDLLIAEINRNHHHCKGIVLVGHEPCLSGLISTLLTGSSHMPITLKKGGLCQLSIRNLRFGGCAQLEWLMTPKQLRMV